MENLEKYINNQLEAFDEEPTSGHYQRFQNKQRKNRRRKTIFLTTQIAVAASLLLFITINILPPQEHPDSVVLCEQSEDMKACYLSQMHDIASHLETITEGMDAWDRQIVANEVNSIINSINDVEFYIPEEFPTKDRKQILANCYQQNIETLQSIVELVTENKSSNK